VAGPVPFYVWHTTYPEEFLMRVATNRDPASVRHPSGGLFVAVRRGDEFPDDDPLVTSPTTKWLFAEDSPAETRTVVEDATARPGAARRLPPRTR